MLLEWSGLGKTGVGRQAGHVGNLLGWDGGGDRIGGDHAVGLVHRFTTVTGWSHLCFKDVFRNIVHNNLHILESR